MNLSGRDTTCFRSFLILAFFCLIGVSVYRNTFNNPFHYDDTHHIETNPYIRYLSNIPSFFTDSNTFSGIRASRGKGFNYRPLVMLTYAFNYSMGELNPIGYHMVNLAFHVGAAFVIYLIVKTMLQPAPYFPALIAGLIFLVHPFNSEVVNYISTRSSVMSGFFYLLAFYCWVLFRSQKSEVRSKKSVAGDQKSYLLPLTSYFYLGSLLAFVAGMLSKEVAITLPLVLWLYDLYFYRSSPAPATRYPLPATYLTWRTYLSYLPFFLIGIIPYLVLRASWLGETFSHSRRGIGTQLFTEIPMIVKHWQMFLIPTPLTPIHDAEVYHTFWSFPVIYSSIILIGYAVIAIFLFRTSSHTWRVVSFFMLWFFIVLLPTTIIPLNLIFQEHRGYLSMVSFIVFAGAVLEESRRVRIQKVVVVLLIIVLGTYSVITIKRNWDWKDDLALWRDTVKKSPKSSIAYTGLGIAYKNLKMYDKSIDALSRALTYDGNGEEILTAHHNLAQIYILQGKWNLAAQELESTLKIYPGNPQLHNDLGIVYYTLGDGESAERHFYISAKIEPMDYLSYFNLGALYSKQGRLEEAVMAYRKVLSLSPDHKEARLRLGMALEGLGKKKGLGK